VFKDAVRVSSDYEKDRSRFRGRVQIEGRVKDRVSDRVSDRVRVGESKTQGARLK